MFKIVLIATSLIALCSAGGNPEDVQATIIKYENELNPDGSYSYDYATSNNIQALESGVGSSYASGSYAYVSPEGQPIQLQYTADENGYQPTGEHLPTPPPIPEYILKSIRYIESHPFDKIVLTHCRYPGSLFNHIPLRKCIYTAHFIPMHDKNVELDKANSQKN